MLLSQLVVGMRIRISKDPIISIKNFGGETAKLEMAGKVKIIRSIERKQNAVMVKGDEGDFWTIHINDIENYIKNTKPLLPIESATFDPNQLVL